MFQQARRQSRRLAQKGEATLNSTKRSLVDCGEPGKGSIPLAPEPLRIMHELADRAMVGGIHRGNAETVLCRILSQIAGHLRAAPRRRAGDKALPIAGLFGSAARIGRVGYVLEGRGYQHTRPVETQRCRDDPVDQRGAVRIIAGKAGPQRSEQTLRLVKFITGGGKYAGQAVGCGIAGGPGFARWRAGSAPLRAIDPARLCLPRRAGCFVSHRDPQPCNFRAWRSPRASSHGARPGGACVQTAGRRARVRGGFC